MKVGSQVVQGKREVMEAIKNYYRLHFQQTTLPKITLPPGFFNTIDQANATKMELIPTRKEIMEAVRRSNGGKSLGYDGYNFRLFQCNWEVIREEVVNFVKNFFITGKFPKSINTIWTTLIHKKDPATCIENFSQHGCVSLQNYIKILAKRLSLVMVVLF